MLLFLLVISFSIFLFSYLWVDGALILTLADGHPVVKNLQILTSFGNLNRNSFALVYILLVMAIFCGQLILLLNNSFSKKSLLLVFFITTLIFSFSYNFLSSDIFTYLFSAKMLWTYHTNPYLVTPEYFVPTDFSVSFLRNIQNTYFYGYISLAYSLIPTIIFSGGRIILNILSLRFINAVLFYITGIIIYRTLNRDSRVFGWWFFSPILIVELLINAHNDLLLVCLFVISICLFYRKKIIFGLLFLLLAAFAKSSGAVYEASIFLMGGLFMFFKEKYLILFSKLAIFGIMIFLQTTNLPIQIWYYTWIYMFVPFARLKTASLIVIGTFGTMHLLNYYSYINSSGWGGDVLIPGAKMLGIFSVLIIGVVEFRGGALRYNIKRL